MSGINKLKFGFSLMMPLLAGAIGSLFTAPAIDIWYKELAKPAFNPPNWIFGPVWTLLYILMGVAFYIVWQSDVSAKKKKVAMWVFILQLALNILWSILFFNLNNLQISFFEIIILWSVILVNLVLFGQIKKLSGWLLAPYLAWVSFAAVLNFSIWQLNP